MIIEDSKFYEENLKPTIYLYFKKEINLNEFVINEKLRNSLSYFFQTILKQQKIDFFCPECVSTAIRYSQACYVNFIKHHQKELDNFIENANKKIDVIKLKQTINNNNESIEKDGSITEEKIENPVEVKQNRIANKQTKKKNLKK